MCLADQRRCALSLWPSDALQRGPEPADSFADKSSAWRKWDLMEMWVLLHFIHAVSTRLKAKAEHGHTGRQSWGCLLDSWGLCVIKQCWPLKGVQNRMIQAKREDKCVEEHWPIRDRRDPLFSGNGWCVLEMLLLAWGAVWQTAKCRPSCCLFFQLLTGGQGLWFRFKWPWLLFLQYCLSQCIRHFGTEPWSSASVSRDITAASQHTWTEICI